MMIVLLLTMLIISPMEIRGNEEWFELQPETDDKVRDCKLYLLFLPMEDYHGKGKHLSKVQKYFGGEDIMVKHWALIFEYNDRVIQYDSGPAMLGSLLVPYVKEIEWNQRANSTYLATIQTSPKAAKEQAIASDLHLTEYDSFKNNCQDWVLELLRMLVPNLPSLAKYEEASIRSKYLQFVENLDQERQMDLLKTEL